MIFSNDSWGFCGEQARNPYGLYARVNHGWWITRATRIHVQCAIKKCCLIRLNVDQRREIEEGIVTVPVRSCYREPGKVYERWKPSDLQRSPRVPVDNPSKMSRPRIVTTTSKFLLFTKLRTITIRGYWNRVPRWCRCLASFIRLKFHRRSRKSRHRCRATTSPGPTRPRHSLKT